MCYDANIFRLLFHCRVAALVLRVLNVDFILVVVNVSKQGTSSLLLKISHQKLPQGFWSDRFLKTLRLRAVSFTKIGCDVLWVSI